MPTLRFAVAMIRFSLLLTGDMPQLHPIQLLNQVQVLQLHVRYFYASDVEVGLYLTHLYRLRTYFTP